MVHGCEGIAQGGSGVKHGVDWVDANRSVLRAGVGVSEEEGHVHMVYWEQISRWKHSEGELGFQINGGDGEQTSRAEG